MFPCTRHRRRRTEHIVAWELAATPRGKEAAQCTQTHDRSSTRAAASKQTRVFVGSVAATVDRGGAIESPPAREGEEMGKVCRAGTADTDTLFSILRAALRSSFALIGLDTAAV